jgi:phosphoglycerate-specific signal transduction histidine kinase
MFEEVTTSRKVFTGLMSALALMLALGATAWYGNHAVEAQVRALVEREFPAYRVVARMNEEQAVVDRTVSTLVHRRLDQAMRRTLYDEHDAALKTFDEAKREAEGLFRGDRAGSWSPTS